MYEINPELHSELRHVKCFGLMTWILGWGVISNAQSINKIKKNLRVLQDQNVLQDHQIKALAKHLNLTMTQVNRHEEMLYELDSKLLILNHTIQDIMVQLSYFRYEYTIMTHIQMRINWIYTSFFELKEDVDTLYEYMRVLSTQQLNPLIMPPDILNLILDQVVDRIKTNARLRLSENPTENMWAYYNIIKITPIVLEDYLMVIITIPLIDVSLDMNLYKVHNLPMIHPDTGIQAEYVLEGQYLTTLTNGMYVTIPQETDIKLCKMSTGHLCILNEPLYLTDRVDWCMYALFTNNLEKMQMNCIIKPKVHLTNLAHSLG